MKGLTPKELLEVTEFVQKHHAFAYVREENRYNGHEGYCIKYIDACYDSRQGDYWAVSFRGMGKIIFTTNAFLFDKPKYFQFNSLYEWIMAFLKYEWEPKGKTFSFMYSNANGKGKPLVNSFPNGEIEREWSDMDMINAYCADLEDGVTSDDTLVATKWIIAYKEKQQKL